MEFDFDHEKLEVYQLAIQFASWTEVLVEDGKGKAASAKKHLDEASSSIPDNIAEGNGTWSKKERKKRRLSCSCSCLLLLPPAPAPAPRVSISGRLFDARPERLRFCCPELNRARLTCPEMP